MLVFAAFLMNNYIRGLRSTTLRLIAEIRQSLWTIHDELRNSPDAAARKLLTEDLLPLEALGRTDWFEPDNFKNWAQNIKPKLDEMQHAETFLLRHLIPLEELIGELGLCYIRGVAAKLHLKSTTIVVYLLIAATLVNVTARLIPHAWLLNIIVFIVCLMTILLTLMEVLHIFSFVKQEASEEWTEFQPGHER
jgi:hypothetical protein